MKIVQLKKVKKVKKAKYKQFIEIAGETIKEMSNSDLDSFTFTIEKGEIVTWMPCEIDIPKALYRELSVLFKDNDEVITKWLKTSKPFLQNKTPIEILDTDCGLASILDLIERLKTGDIS